MADKNRGCSEAGCKAPHVARGFCHRHYRAFLKAGGVRKFTPTRHYGKTAEERFWLYTEQGPRCWEWTGYKNAKGYGVLNLGGQRILAHRFGFQLVADIPDGLFVLHHCDNPGCVKFKHLYLGTRAENNAAMFARGRNRNPGLKGSGNHRARLDEADIRAIRASTKRAADLATEYGVSRTHIHGIKRRLYWAHID